MSTIRSYLIAAALGILGLALNQISAPLLTEETPQFVFGGAAVFLAFLWLGYGPGIFAGVVSLSVLWSQGDAAGLATAVYLVEGVGAYWIYQRVGSLVFAAGVYWFTAGLVLDVIVYWWLIGLQTEYVVLLFVKQVFNGCLNAVLSEGISLGFRLERGNEAMPLRPYLFRRVAFAAAIPALFLALLLTRTVYAARLDLAHSRAQTTAQAAEARFSSFVRENVEALNRLARLLEIRWRLEGAAPEGMLDEFRERRTRLRLVALADATGTLLESSPARDIGGRELRGVDVSDRGYFQEAARTLQTVYSPLLIGRVRLYQQEPESVVVIAEPLVDEEGRFVGLLTGGLDLRRLPELLADVRSSPDEILTLVDGSGAVVASLDPELETGTDGVGWFGERLLDPPGEDPFPYYPPLDDTLESRLALDLRHVVVREVTPGGWRVVVELPAESLYGEVMPAALSALAFFPTLLVLLYAGGRRFLRRVSEPLVVLHDEAQRVSAGEPATPARRLAALARSPVTEVRSLGVQFDEMLRTLNERSRAAARALHHSETQLEHLLTLVEAVVWRGDLDTLALSYVSPQAERLLGRPLDEWLEPEFWDRSIHPDDRDAAFAERRSAVGRRGSCQHEYRMLAADDRVVWVREVASIQSAGTGENEMIAVMIDVTVSKELEEQLREADRIESLGRLAGGVAHDFNNLLTAINGYADLILERHEGDADAHDAREIRRAGERAATLTRQLLAFGRRQLLRPEELDLNQVVLDVAQMLRRVIGAGIELETELAESLRAVRADRGMLEQVLVNLVVNARDAMPDGGTLTIRTANLDPPPRSRSHSAASPPAPEVLLEVADTGHGMDESTRARIFDPFFTTKEPGKGTGLGLSTVYGIVQQSGGQIVCESEPGEGATFRIRLPAATAAGTMATQP